VVPEALLERVETGVRPSGEGWFVVNARDVPWFETDRCGFYAVFEPENARFDQVGFGVGILRPGEPSALYHGEDAQEDFLILAGECLLLIEGEERRDLGRGRLARASPRTDVATVNPSRRSAAAA
jgi:hypothetical protein